MAISIEFVANLRDLINGIEKGEVSIEELKDYIDSVGEAGEDAGKQAERGFDDLADSAKDAQEDVAGVGEEVDDAGGKLGGLGETARDVLEGDVSGAAESAAEALSGLGPAAGAAGVIGAVGIGAITTALSQQQEEANETRDSLIGMYREAAEEGRKYLDEAQIIAAANDVLFNTDKRKEAQEEANRIGVDLLTYIRAQAGDQAALNTVLERGNALLEEAAAIGDDKSKAGQAAALQEKNAIEAVVRENERLRDIHLEGQEAATLAGQLVAEQQQAQRDEINRTADVAAARYQGVAAAAGAIPEVITPTIIFDVDDSAYYRALENARKNARIRLEITDGYGRNY